MKVIYIALISVVSTVFADDWIKWKRKHGKTYEKSEDIHRKILWENSKYYVGKQQEKFLAGNATYRTELNKFADFGYSELRSKYTRSYIFSALKVANETSEERGSLRLPKHVDWRRKNGINCVSKVHDQGGPGSCFAFSAIGAIEGQLCRKKKKLTPLSIQQIIDCDSTNCGGYLPEIYKYIRTQGGVMSYNDYPYSSCLDCMQCLVQDPQKTFIPMINRFLCNNKCKFDLKRKKVTVKGYVRVPPDEISLKKAVATIGPIAAGIDARHNFLLYSKHYDIYYEPKCSRTTVNHAVLIVGYGTTRDGKDYWIVKNSWGEDWGARGYVRMSRNRDNNCGISTAAMYPKID